VRNLFNETLYENIFIDGLICFFARKFAAYLRGWSGCRARPSAAPGHQSSDRNEANVVGCVVAIIVGPIELVVLVPSLGAAV